MTECKVVGTFTRGILCASYHSFFRSHPELDLEQDSVITLSLTGEWVSGDLQNSRCHCHLIGLVTNLGSGIIF